MKNTPIKYKKGDAARIDKEGGSSVDYTTLAGKEHRIHLLNMDEDDARQKGEMFNIHPTLVYLPFRHVFTFLYGAKSDISAN